MPQTGKPIRRGQQRLFTLDTDAVAILDAMANGPKDRGALVSRLLFEERARAEERIRMREVVAAEVERAIS